MAQSVMCNGFEITLDAELGDFKADLTCQETSRKGLFEVRLSLSADAPATLPKLALKWDLPSVDFHNKWNSKCFQNRGLDAGTGTENVIPCKANSGMPAYSLHNLASDNVCTFALSEIVHDTELGGLYTHGKFYESRAVVFGEKIDPVTEYAVTLRMDFRPIPYYRALADVTAWWETMPAGKPCPSPAAARMPVLSSWYSYNLNIDPDDLEAQCAMAKQLGMDTVILDDGWQTNQRDFGYQNNGDWEVCEEKLPKFAEHVKRVQGMGMKYVVWFSVPFVGVESKAHERFKDMLLPAKPGARWFSLDPRFPQVREHLAETFENFIRRYGIDGFKMDFIATMTIGKGMKDTPDDRRDCKSIGEGVCKLLGEATARVRAVNPDAMFEFRQPYNGPAMRQFGNMFRAVDCPNSIGDNRVRTLDIRLMSGSTITHSDPITWHDDEPAHSAAMQIIHAIFSVPQISRKVTELTEIHRRMVQWQMAFFREHSDVLLDGEIRPLAPHLLYPLVAAKSDKKLLAAYYAHMPLTVDEEIPEKLILLNGSYSPEVLLDLVQPLGPAKMTVTDCTGEVIGETDLDLEAGMNRLAVPPAASAVITRR